MKPDHDIEQFWLAFKQSMLNLYGQTSCKQIMPARPISDWSDRLNRLQKTARYETIEQNIYNFMTLYGIDLLRVGDRYHLGIFITNIKCWNKVAAKYPFHDGDGESSNNLIFILLEIVSNFIKCDLEFENLFSDIELYLIHEDYTNLLDFAVKHNKPVIIDKLMAFDSLAIINSLNTYWHLELDIANEYKISGKKIIELIDLTQMQNTPPTLSN